MLRSKHRNSKKVLGLGSTSGVGITLALSEYMNEIMKILKSLEDSNLIIDEISKTVKNEIKE